MPKDAFVQQETTKNWLNHLRFKDQSIRELEKRISDIRYRLLLKGCDPSAEGGGGASDSLSKGTSMLVDLETEWEMRIEQHLKGFETWKDLCAPEFVERHAAWLRYVEGLPWEEVAQRTAFSRRNAIRNAESGLKELYPLVPEEYKRSAFPNAAPW